MSHHFPVSLSPPGNFMFPGDSIEAHQDLTPPEGGIPSAPRRRAWRMDIPIRKSPLLTSSAITQFVTTSTTSWKNWTPLIELERLQRLFEVVFFSALTVKT